MAREPADSLSREQRVDEAIADYLEALDQGRAPDRAEFVARHPDLATDLAAFFDDHDGVGRLTSPLPPETPDGRDAPTLPLGPPAGTPAPDPGLRLVGDCELLAELGRG